MVPIADDSTTAGQAPIPEMAPSTPVDPVRAIVHAMLAIYLSPVILVVCMIGAAAVLAGKTLGLMHKVSNGLSRGKSSQPAQAGHLRKAKMGPRLIHRRERSRSTR